MRLPDTAPLRDFGLLLLCAVVLVVCVLVGTTRASEGGPVELRGDSGACLVVARTGQYTQATTVLRNTSRRPVTVTDVRLRDAEGLSLVESFVVPVRQGDVLGALPRWPPSQDTIETTGAAWGERLGALGADRLDPAAGTQDWNLVLRLRVAEGAARSSEGRVGGVEVGYVARDRTFATRADLDLVVRGAC